MKRILIVGTAPYDKNCQSRAFESYFHGIESKYLAQFFSYPYVPPKGHCGSLYQVTDEMMLKRFFSKKTKVGVKYDISELSDEGGIRGKQNDSNHKRSRFISFLYKLGKKDRPITYLLRNILWKKKNWCTESFNKWLDEFNPEIVFLSFSDDFFIPKIALYIANRYNIPIVSSIADDYFFNDRFSISPFYHIYRHKYKHLINEILTRKNSSAIYIGDKIKKQYNDYFGLNGITMYLTSDIKRHQFKAFNKINPRISYYGNLRLGRYQTLQKIGIALNKINPSYHIDIFSNEKDSKIISILQKSVGIKFRGSVPYSEVINGMLSSDLLLIVESFEKKQINIVKYSISTKVPDSLATGSNLFVCGAYECGAIGYLYDSNCTCCCINEKEIFNKLNELICDKKAQNDYYFLSNELLCTNHLLKDNVRKFNELIENLGNE